MEYLSGARCVMCLRGVHNREGRVACDGCDLPTDCCLCLALEESVPALPAGRTERRRR